MIYVLSCVNFVEMGRSGPIMAFAWKEWMKKAWFGLPRIKERHNLYISNIRSQYNYNNDVPSIICSSCIGGLISHNLGLQFCSPTVNLWIDNQDFVKFACNLEGYLQKELVFDEAIENPGQFKKGKFPIAKLGDITVYFNHYHTAEEAATKWNERKQRIHYDNLFLITDDNRLTDEEINRLQSVPCKRFILFTARPRPEIDNSFWMKRYSKTGYLGNYNNRDRDGLREFEKSFNYARWLNGENDFSMDT